MSGITSKRQEDSRRRHYDDVDYHFLPPRRNRRYSPTPTSYSRSRSRSYSRSRSRSRSKTRSRSPIKKNYRQRYVSKSPRRSRSRSPSSYSNYSSESYYGHRDNFRENEDDGYRYSKQYKSRHDRPSNHRDGQDENYVSSKTYVRPDPNAEVVVRGISLMTTESDLQVLLNQLGVLVASIKVVRDKITGQSKGYGFIHCLDISMASKLIQEQKINPIILHTLPLRFDYSYNNPSLSKLEHGWFCSKCSIMNFERRESCFMCKLSKSTCQGIPPTKAWIDSQTLSSSKSTTNDGSQDACFSFSPLLLLTCLDILTKEETIFINMAYGGVYPRRIWLVKDKLTNQSCGFAFIEYPSHEITKAVETYFSSQSAPYFIDNKMVHISYGRDLYAYNSIDAVQTQSYPDQDPIYMLPLQRKSTLDYWDHLSYLHPYPPLPVRLPNSLPTSLSSVSYTATGNDITAEPTQDLNTWSMKISSAPSNPLGKEENIDPLKAFYTELSTIDMASTDHNSMHRVSPQITENNIWNPPPPLPLSASETYSESKLHAVRFSKKGLKMTSTGLFHDPSIDAYYFYQTSTRSYIPVNLPSNDPEITKTNNFEIPPSPIAQPSVTGSPSMTVSNKPALIESLPTIPKSYSSLLSTPAPILSSATSSKKIHLQLQKWESKKAEMSLDVKPIQKASVAVIDKANDKNIPNFMDKEKNICTLCQRQFKSFAELEKHTELSQLHKTNLGNYERGPQSTKVEISGSKYRNRAQERREKIAAIIAETNLPPPQYTSSKGTEEDDDGDEASHNREDLAADFVQVDSPSIGIGAQLLKKMGWKEGEGLGKHQTGILEPIKAETVVGGKGLGAPGSKQIIHHDLSSDGKVGFFYQYSGQVKQSTRERYRELDQEN